MKFTVTFLRDSQEFWIPPPIQNNQPNMDRPRPRILGFTLKRSEVDTNTSKEVQNGLYFFSESIDETFLKTEYPLA